MLHDGNLNNPPSDPGSECYRQTVRQYLVELKQQNPTDEPVHEQKLVSTTDPDATYASLVQPPSPGQLSGGQPQLRDRGKIFVLARGALRLLRTRDFNSHGHAARQELAFAAVRKRDCP